MAKAIYSLKVFLFRNQLKLISHEAAGVTSVSTFVSLIYARYWHEAPLAEHALVNDMKRLSQLHDYPQQTIREAAISAFSRHLWYIYQRTLSHLLSSMIVWMKRSKLLWRKISPDHPMRSLYTGELRRRVLTTSHPWKIMSQKDPWNSLTFSP